MNNNLPANKLIMIELKEITYNTNNPKNLNLRK